MHADATPCAGCCLEIGWIQSSRLHIPLLVNEELAIAMVILFRSASQTYAESQWAAQQAAMDHRKCQQGAHLGWLARTTLR
jgi:hypothetical protein